MLKEEFIKKNISTWKDFELTIKKIRFGGIKRLSSIELNNFIDDYNKVCSHLSYAKTYYGDSDIDLYLNSIVKSGHGYIYSTKSAKISALLTLFFREFPLLFKKYFVFFVLSTSIFLAATAISFVLTYQDKDNYSLFLTEEYENIDFSDDSNSVSWNGLVASNRILTNNIQVGILSYVLGLSLGIGTVWVLVNNAFVLGSLSALAHLSDGELNYWSMILPHGILELFAIFVCGACGLIIAYSIINPGQYSRKNSLVLKGKDIIKLGIGTIPIFIVAGIIEGFLTPSEYITPEGKLVFAGITVLVIILYIIIPNLYYNNENKKTF